MQQAARSRYLNVLERFSLEEKKKRLYLQKMTEDLGHGKKKL